MENKKPWQSKTLWVAALTAVAAFFPSVQQFIAGNPETFAVLLGLVFAALRIITKGKVAVD